MRVVIQRVSKAWVAVEGTRLAEIGTGCVVLLGIGTMDSASDAHYLAEKIANMRIFSDDNGKFNYSLIDVGGEVLVVSQFTLYGDCRKGRRPNFIGAASPQEALPLYENFVQSLKNKGLKTVTGQFQAMMEVGIVNDGPVTIMLDSQKNF